MDLFIKHKCNFMFFGLVNIWMSLIFLPLPAMAQAWKWIAFGDTRNNKPEHREVLEAIMANTPDYKFIINVGDVVDHGDSLSEWQAWHQTTIDVLGDMGQDKIPPKYMSTPGNHDATETEAGLLNWNTFLPGQVDQFGNEGKFFTFDYENARFLIMDSDKSSKTEEQFTMMMKALQNDPKSWLFVITHRPIFEFGKYTYNDEIHDTWGIPLYRYGCDFIFNGHDHFYLRTKRVELDGNINPPLDAFRGVTEVITSNGGASLVDIVPDKDGNEYIVDKYIKEHGYTELTITGDSLRLRHILKNGTVFDEANFGANPKTPVSKVDNDKISVPDSFKLMQNYPNPFNPSTRICFYLSNASQITLKIYDINGREVDTLVEGFLPGGTYEVPFKTKNRDGLAFPSGIYFYQIKSDRFRQSRKMVLLQ